VAAAQMNGNKFGILRCLLTATLLLQSTIGTGADSNKSQKRLTPVQVDFIEALDSKDNDYSERFRKEFESAIAEGVGARKSRLAKCGYKIHSERRYFEKSDPLKAKELAATAETSGSWFIVAPARSNHYLLSAAGAPNTASISILASSRQVFELPNQHLTLSHSNKQMAQAAAAHAMKLVLLNGSAQYIAVVSADCSACVDFAAEFKFAAEKLGIKQQLSVEVNGEDPSLQPIEDAIKAASAAPDFVLLPNYSMVSSRLMAKMSALLPQKTFYVGADGWGTSKFGYVQNANGLDKVAGFSVRSFPPAAQALTYLRIGKQIVSQNRAAEFESTSAIGVFTIIESLEMLLCSAKPKSRDEFREAFSSKGPSLFKTAWNPSIYELKSGELTFAGIADVPGEK
jgi:ABC-type branched-subunit amino acid transport system substrate-binding protein